MEELYPTLLGLTQLAGQYDIGINIDAEEADRLEISSICWRSSASIRPRRLERHRLRHPGLPEALPLCDRLRHRSAKRSRHRLMIRLVKGAYWDSEIKRAQQEGLEGYPVYTRKPHTDVSHLACARKLLAVPRPSIPSSPPTTPTPLSAIISWRVRTTTRASTSSSACTAWVNRSTNRWSARWPTASWVVPAASMPRWAAMRPCSPTWCAACWRTGQHLLRQPHRGQQHLLSDLVQDPVQQIEQMAAREGTLGLPHPRIPCPGSLRRGAPELRRSGSRERAPPGVTLRRPARQHQHRLSGVPMLGCDTEAPTQFQPVLNPADHRDVVGQGERSHGSAWTRRSPAPHERPDLAVHPASRAGRRAGQGRRSDGIRTATPDGPAGPRIRQDLRQRHRRGARGGGLPALLRRPGAQPLRQRHPQTVSGPVVCISPWNFRWPSSAARCARPWPPAIRCWPSLPSRPLIAAQAVRILLEAGFPPVRCNCCRAVERPWVRRSSRTNGARRHVHRLHRGGGHHLPQPGRSPRRPGSHHSPSSPRPAARTP